jgi:ABC-type uncharacterized transport system auxiliary subunit
MRSAPAPVPQLLAEAAVVHEAPAPAPVRLAAAAPAAARVEAQPAIVVRAPPMGLRLARALALPSLPPLESRQLAVAELEPALSAALAPSAPRVRMASASPAHMRAMVLRLADSGTMAVRTTEASQTFVYGTADPAERARIEEAVRDALAEARKAHAKARIFVHLAQVANAAGADGAWTKVKFQVVEQGEYQ